MQRRRITWHNQFPDVDFPVWIDVAKLDAAWQLDDGYVGPPGSARPGNQPGKYPRAGKWFEQHLYAYMPVVSPVGDAVSFTDGRHRFAWLRDHEVKALPIVPDARDVAEMRRRFGTRLRVSRLL